MFRRQQLSFDNGIMFSEAKTQASVSVVTAAVPAGDSDRAVEWTPTPVEGTEACWLCREHGVGLPKAAVHRHECILAACQKLRLQSPKHSFAWLRAVIWRSRVAMSRLRVRTPKRTSVPVFPHGRQIPRRTQMFAWWSSCACRSRRPWTMIVSSRHSGHIRRSNGTSPAQCSL
jgi:hypothetical protein